MPIDVQALVQEASRLEPLSRSAIRISSLIADESWEPEDLFTIVAQDPPLTGKVLGAANSARTGARAAVTSVPQAAMLLGPRHVLGLAMASGVRGRLQRALPEYGIDEGDLWRHSLAAFLAVETLRNPLRIPLPEAASPAALLHDIGKIVLARFLDPELLTFLRRARDEGRQSSLEAEMEVLEVTHGELGALIARGWGLPEAITRPIALHDNPLDTDDEVVRRSAAAVQLADCVAKAAGAAAGVDEGDENEHLEPLSILGLSLEHYGSLAQEVRGRLDQALALYN